MAMLPMDLDDLDRDIHETFEEIGDSLGMDALRLIPSDGGIYKEERYKTYEPFCRLTGRIRLNPLMEELSDIGRKKGCTSIFTFDCKQLKDKGILLTEEGTNRQECQITLNDAIRYKGHVYLVDNIHPVAMIGDRFLLYKFECHEADESVTVRGWEDV